MGSHPLCDYDMNINTYGNGKYNVIAMPGSSDAAKSRYEDVMSDEQENYRQNRSMYIEKLGNCKEINIPGSHFIYEEKPEECAKVINDFIDDFD